MSADTPMFATTTAAAWKLQRPTTPGAAVPLASTVRMAAPITPSSTATVSATEAPTCTLAGMMTRTPPQGFARMLGLELGEELLGHPEEEDGELIEDVIKREAGFVKRWHESAIEPAPADRRRYKIEELKKIGQGDGWRTSQARLEAIESARWIPSEAHDSPRKRPRAEFMEDTHSGILRTADALLTGKDTDADFDQLMLPQSLLVALKKCGFHRPSPVQLRAIPLGRLGLDLIAQAKSGTGKTVVFCVMAIETALARAGVVSPIGPSAIILAPTREIALQITSVAAQLAEAMEGPSISVCTFIGGVSVTRDIDAISKGVDIAVGTPGRLKALLRDGALKASMVRLLVLDEADKLLDGTFRETIPWIVSAMPVQKQITTFSATFPAPLLTALKKVMRDPQYISLNEKEISDGPFSGAILKGVQQYKLEIPDHFTLIDRARAACSALRAIPFQQCICFCNDKVAGKRISQVFKDDGFNAAFTSGTESQAARSEVIHAIRDDKIRVLVSTDLISRGVDLPNCNMVINIDLPKEVQDYLHRVGRAGRFGTAGTAVTVTPQRDISKIERQLNFELDILQAETTPAKPRSELLLPSSNPVEQKKRSRSPGNRISDRQDVSDSINVEMRHENDRDEYMLPAAAEAGSTENTRAEQLLPAAAEAGSTENTRAEHLLHAAAEAGGTENSQGHQTLSYPEEWVCYWEGFTAAYRLGREAARAALRQQSYND